MGWGRNVTVNHVTIEPTFFCSVFIVKEQTKTSYFCSINIDTTTRSQQTETIFELFLPFQAKSRVYLGSPLTTIVRKTYSVYKKTIYLDSTRETWPGIPFNVATIVRKTVSAYIKRIHLDSTREIQSKTWSNNHHGKQRKSMKTHTLLHTEVHKPRDSLEITATKAFHCYTVSLENDQ